MSCKEAHCRDKLECIGDRKIDVIRFGDKFSQTKERGKSRCLESCRVISRCTCCRCRVHQSLCKTANTVCTSTFRSAAFFSWDRPIINFVKIIFVQQFSLSPQRSAFLLTFVLVYRTKWSLDTDWQASRSVPKLWPMAFVNWEATWAS